MRWIDQFSLVNQVALVTGASGGLGRELAAILADAGAALVLADTNESKLKELAQEIDPSGEKVLVQKCDVTNKQDILSLIENAHNQFKSIDILINCAGILGPDELLFDVSESDWDSVLNVNLKGSWLAATHISEYMVAHKIAGRIVNISSSLGFR
jgi:3-oxoacyl-[acyl-carrier protein] reductase